MVNSFPSLLSKISISYLQWNLYFTSFHLFDPAAFLRPHFVYQIFLHKSHGKLPITDSFFS